MLWCVRLWSGRNIECSRVCGWPCHSALWWWAEAWACCSVGATCLQKVKQYIMQSSNNLDNICRTVKTIFAERSKKNLPYDQKNIYRTIKKYLPNDRKNICRTIQKNMCRTPFLELWFLKKNLYIFKRGLDNSCLATLSCRTFGGVGCNTRNS